MLPTELIQLIQDYYGTDNENYIRRGLRYMFLLSPGFFTWGSDREQTLHIFLRYYETAHAKDFVDHLLLGINWQTVENHWATSSELNAILSALK